MLIHTPPLLEFFFRICKAAIEKTSSRNKGVATMPAPRHGSGTRPDSIRASLRELKIFPGDLLMVHSDTGAIGQWGLSPSEMIDFLLEYLGDRGTLAMPCHPKLKTENGRRLYNVRRSPSTVGIMTELFRRRKATVRSEYPFSAAAAQGRLAEELVSFHRHSFAPHDELSPYGKLAELGGKAIAIGCPLDRMTLIHVAEDTMRHVFPIRDFYTTETVLVKNGKETFTVNARKRADWLWWYLAKYQWTCQMYQNGFAREATLSGVRIFQMDARPMTRWMQDRARLGKTVYPLAKLNRIFKFKGQLT